MKNIIINIIGKYLGINKVLEWVNGYGSHIAGGGIALMGLSQILIDLVPVLATKNPSTIVTFASSLAAHPGAQTLPRCLPFPVIRAATLPIIQATPGPTA